MKVLLQLQLYNNFRNVFEPQLCHASDASFLDRWGRYCHKRHYLSGLAVSIRIQPVHHHIDQVVEFVSFHAVLAYLLVFVSAFLEAIPIIGAIVPGSTVIFALSALVPSGSLKVIPLVIAAIIGAAFGDGLAYGFGYWQKHRVLSVWPLSKYPKLVAES